HFCSSFSSFAGFPQKDMHFCSSSRQLWLYASSACKKNRTFASSSKQLERVAHISTGLFNNLFNIVYGLLRTRRRIHMKISLEYKKPGKLLNPGSGFLQGY